MCIVYENEAGELSGLFKPGVLIYFKTILLPVNKKIIDEFREVERVRHFLAIRSVSGSQLGNLLAPIWKRPTWGANHVI